MAISGCKCEHPLESNRQRVRERERKYNKISQLKSGLLSQSSIPSTIKHWLSYFLCFEGHDLQMVMQIRADSHTIQYQVFKDVIQLKGVAVETTMALLRKLFSDSSRNLLVCFHFSQSNMSLVKSRSYSNRSVIESMSSEGKTLHPGSLILLLHSKSFCFRSFPQYLETTYIILLYRYLQQSSVFHASVCFQSHPGRKSKYANRVILQDASLSWE